MKKEKIMHELAKEFPDKTYRELEIYREKDRQQEAGACIIGVTDWQEEYNKEHKLRQEAEGELSIMKGIETNRVKEAQAALANALEVNESHQKFNGKLQERLTELEEENKKMHDAFDKQIDGARKAGL
jgi:septin family protein